MPSLKALLARLKPQPTPEPEPFETHRIDLEKARPAPRQPLFRNRRSPPEA